MFAVGILTGIVTGDEEVRAAAPSGRSAGLGLVIAQDVSCRDADLVKPCQDRGDERKLKAHRWVLSTHLIFAPSKDSCLCNMRKMGPLMSIVCH